MVGYRGRRWANIEPTLGRSLLFARNDLLELNYFTKARILVQVTIYRNLYENTDPAT